MTSLKRAVEANTGNGLSIRRKTKEEKRNAVSIFEVAPTKRLFETSASVDPLCAVQVDLPEVWSFHRMMALEANSGLLIDKTGAVSVPVTHDVSH